MNGVSIQALPSSRADAAPLALRLGVPVHAIAQHGFPDGEMRVTIGPATPIAILYGSLDRPNDRLIAARPALQVDDVVSSGATLTACASAMAAAGAAVIDAIITHALFPAGMTGAFAGAGIRSVRSTHSVPHPANVLDDLFAAALQGEISQPTCPELPA